MTFSVADDGPRLPPWLKVTLIILVVLSIPIGLYAIAGSLFLLTFGPGNQMMKWMPDHFFVFGTAICSTLVGTGATLSLFLSSIRPLLGTLIFAAVVAIGLLLRSI